MNWRKPLAGVALALVVGWTLLVVVTLAGVGVDPRLPGSESQTDVLVTAAVIIGALTAYAALGTPWRDTETPYW